MRRFIISILITTDHAIVGNPPESNLRCCFFGPQFKRGFNTSLSDHIDDAHIQSVSHGNWISTAQAGSVLRKIAVQLPRSFPMTLSIRNNIRAICVGSACLPRLARPILQDKIRCNEPLVATRSNREALKIRNQVDVEERGENLLSPPQSLVEVLAVSQIRTGH